MEKENNGCAFGKVLENRVVTLEREMGEVRKAVIDIRDRLLQRPSWAVCVIITFLSSVASGSILGMVWVLMKK